MCVRPVSDTWLTGAEDQGGENVPPGWTLINLVLLWCLGVCCLCPIPSVCGWSRESSPVSALVIDSPTQCSLERAGRESASVSGC